MRPAIFHAFGKAKIGAQKALRDLEQQGWETLPLAILGMPNLPPAWIVDDWKPMFTGYCPGIVGNSALRFCLLLRWRAVHKPTSELWEPCRVAALAVVQRMEIMKTWSQPILPRLIIRKIEQDTSPKLLRYPHLRRGLHFRLPLFVPPSAFKREFIKWENVFSLGHLPC